MVGACNSSARDTRACDMASLKAIDSARASEGLGPLDLPAGYETLAMPAQLVVVTNAERTSRRAASLAFARRQPRPSGCAGAGLRYGPERPCRQHVGGQHSRWDADGPPS